MRFSLLLACSIVGLSSCSLVNPIEIKVVSAEVISLAEAGDAWTYFDKTQGVRKSEIFLLKINFESRQNLRELVLTKRTHLFPEAGLCDDKRGQMKLVYVLSGIKKENIFINYSLIRDSKEEKISHSQNEINVYNAFIPLAGEELARLEGNVSRIGGFPFLDMRGQSENICFWLSEGQIWVGKFGKSNISVLPRTKINGFVIGR